MSVHHLDLTEIAQQVLDELPQNVEYIRDPRKIKPTNTDELPCTAATVAVHCFPVLCVLACILFIACTSIKFWNSDIIIVHKFHYFNNMK